MRMGKKSVQPDLQPFPGLDTPTKELIPFQGTQKWPARPRNRPDDGHKSGHEESSCLVAGSIEQGLFRGHRAQGEIARGESFSHDDDVRDKAEMAAGQPLSGPADPGHNSSAMRRTSFRSQIRRTVSQYRRGGTEAPVDEPPITSPMKARHSSAPACRWPCPIHERTPPRNRTAPSATDSGNNRAPESAALLRAAPESRLVVFPRRKRQRPRRISVVARAERDHAVLFRPPGIIPKLRASLMDASIASDPEVKKNTFPFLKAGRRHLGGQPFDGFVT